MGGPLFIQAECEVRLIVGHTHGQVVPHIHSLTHSYKRLTTYHTYLREYKSYVLLMLGTNITHCARYDTIEAKLCLDPVVKLYNELENCNTKCVLMEASPLR